MDDWSVALRLSTWDRKARWAITSFPPPSTLSLDFSQQDSFPSPIRIHTWAPDSTDLCRTWCGSPYWSLSHIMGNLRLKGQAVIWPTSGVNHFLRQITSHLYCVRQPIFGSALSATTTTTGPSDSSNSINSWHHAGISVCRLV